LSSLLRLTMTPHQSALRRRRRTRIAAARAASLRRCRIDQFRPSRLRLALCGFRRRAERRVIRWRGLARAESQSGCRNKRLGWGQRRTLSG